MVTLVLTPWMSAHRVVSWETAICLVYVDRAEVLEEYAETVRSPSVEMRVPCVIRLKRVVVSAKRGVRFSRINVMTRDGFRCQYCGERKPMSQLNFDHVVPKAQGGRTVWGNVVTACYRCNIFKANRTPSQAGMKLLKTPVCPKALPLTGPNIVYPGAPEVWGYYLGEGAHLAAG